jgi:hypothetical protein
VCYPDATIPFIFMNTSRHNYFIMINDKNV